MDMVSNVENICMLINPLNNLQNHLLRLSSHNWMKIEEDFIILNCVSYERMKNERPCYLMQKRPCGHKSLLFCMC